VSRAAITLAAVIGAASIVGTARADGDPGGADDIVGRDLVLDAGMITADAVLELSISRNQIWDPASLAADISYGVTGDLTIGVVHSARALGVIRTGDGLCFRGSAHLCREAYANTGVDVRYALWRGRLSVAARLRTVIGSYEPWKPSVRPGAVVRWRYGRFSVTADAHFQFGLANRLHGNRDWLRVPVWIAVQPARRIALAFRLGVEGELATWEDTYQLPLGLEATVRATEHVDISAFAGFPALGGPQNRFITRVAWISIGGRWR
jgi:hypothetical protein